MGKTFWTSLRPMVLTSLVSSRPCRVVECGVTHWADRDDSPRTFLSLWHKTRFSWEARRNKAWERDWVLTTSYYACTIQTHLRNPVRIGEAKRSLLPSFLLRSQLVWLFLSFFTLSFHAQTSRGKRSMIVGLFFMRCIKTINYPQVEP